MNPTIRRATPDDDDALASLSAATFTETFGHLYPPEDLQEFLDRTCTPRACREVLEQATSGVWLAVHEDAGPIGFVHAGRCKLPVQNPEPRAGEIKQLYVLARYQNLHLGTKLMDIALDWLAGEGFTPIYIGVWSQNHGAQRFYARYGFSKVGEYGFPVGKTVDREFILSNLPQ